MFLTVCSKHNAEQRPLQEMSFSPSLEVKSLMALDFLHQEHNCTFCDGLFPGGDVYVMCTPVSDSPVCKSKNLGL